MPRRSGGGLRRVEDGRGARLPRGGGAARHVPREGADRLLLLVAGQHLVRVRVGVGVRVRGRVRGRVRVGVRVRRLQWRRVERGEREVEATW